MRHALLAAALVAAIPLAGCIASNSGSFGQLAVDENGCIDASGVDNQPGSFDYGGLVRCKTATESYDWSNPSVYGEIAWGGSAAAGSVHVTISDGLDRVVYDFTIDGTGSDGAAGRTDPGFPGPTGLTGPWTIDVEFENFTGTMGLTVSSA